MIKVLLTTAAAGKIMALDLKWLNYMSFIAILQNKLNNFERADFIIMTFKIPLYFQWGSALWAVGQLWGVHQFTLTTDIHLKKRLYLHLPFVHKLKVKVFHLSIISSVFLSG